MAIAARVDPQDGHGTWVTCLKIQTPKAGDSVASLDTLYHNQRIPVEQAIDNRAYKVFLVKGIKTRTAGFYLNSFALSHFES